MKILPSITRVNEVLGRRALKLSPPASNVADTLRIVLDFSTLFFCFCLFDGILVGLTGMSTSQGTTRLPYRGKAKSADVQTGEFDSSTLIVIRLKTAFSS